MPVAAITLRNEKGAALTHDEMDLNWSRLENFVNSLETLLGQITNADGTIKNNLVVTASIVDRAVTTLKRAFASNFFYTATGTPDAIVITNPVGATMAALPSGFACYIKTIAANTGPVTLKVDALAPVAVVKLNGQALFQADIPENAVLHVASDGVVFYLLTVATQSPGVTGIVSSQGVTNSTSLTNALQEIGTVTLTKPAGTIWTHIRIQFSTQLEGGSGTNSGCDGWEAQVGGAPVTGMVIAGNATAHADNSDDNQSVYVMSEGVPTGFSGSNSLTFSIMLKKAAAPFDANGDTLTARRLYAVGYYGLA